MNLKGVNSGKGPICGYISSVDDCPLDRTFAVSAVMIHFFGDIASVIQPRRTHIRVNTMTDR